MMAYLQGICCNQRPSSQHKPHEPSNSARASIGFWLAHQGTYFMNFFDASGS